MAPECGEAAWQPVSEIFGNWAQKLSFLSANNNLRYVIILLLFVLVSYLILRSNKKWTGMAVVRLGLIPLFCGSFLQVISYHATGYAAEKYWYWVSELVFIVLFLSLLVGVLFRQIPFALGKKTITWGVVAVFGLWMGASYWNSIRATMPYGYWAADAPYIDIIPTLEANTEPGSLIGMTGGGNTGYFIHDRTIVNMDGLINSKSYFEAFKSRAAGDFLEGVGLDYVIANPYILSSQPYKGMFDAYLTENGVEFENKLLMKFGKSP